MVILRGYKMKKIVVFIAVAFILESLFVHEGSTGQKSTSLGAPLMLKLMIVSDGFKLSWKPLEKQDSITGYEILRADIASGPFISIGKVGQGVFEYVDNTAAPEIIYYYKVGAMTGAELSFYSNTVTGER